MIPGSTQGLPKLRIYLLGQIPILFLHRDARNMARDVHEILVEIFCENGNMTQEEAAAYLKRMESQRRYSADVWS